MGHLLSGVQRALDGGFARGQKISYTERILYWYHEEVDRVIGPDRIDPAMRITPVLAPFMES